MEVEESDRDSQEELRQFSMGCTPLMSGATFATLRVMRTVDIERLQQPYPANHFQGRGGYVPEIGLDLRIWAQLEDAIVSDLAESPPYGIGWWAPHPGTKRRILISDQLYTCVNSVSTNMLEALLHWLEYQDAAEARTNSGALSRPC